MIPSSSSLLSHHHHYHDHHQCFHKVIFIYFILYILAAKELDSRNKRHLEDTDDIGQDTPKKIRRQFSESQKKALFSIFRETKKPPKEMQRAIAEELGLDLTTVSNFFMNARRRHVSE